MAQEESLATAASMPVPLRSPYTRAVSAALRARRAMLDAALDEMDLRSKSIARAASLLVSTICSGHKVLVAGNGGSAAEAQHFAGELVGRFKRERAAYPVLSLTVDTSIITAVANDYSYHDVFARQVAALGQPGDLFVAISTSGASENLIRAAQTAHERSMPVIGITGERRSPLERVADLAIRVPVVDTAIAQELHTMIVHILCDIAEKELAASERGIQA